MRHRMRVGGTAVVLAVLGVAAAACGSSGAATPASGQTGFQAYAACLARNGVTLPTGNFGNRSPGAGPSGQPSPRPSGSGGPGRGGFGGFSTQAPAGVDQATWEKAQQACASVRPTGGPGGFRNDSAMIAYRNCLSEHGMTPTTGPNQLNSADPTVAAAMKACEVLRPTGRPRPSATG